MTQVKVHIHIAAPAERVWEVVMDPQRFDDWVTIHRRVHKADDGPPRPGMRMEQTLCLRGANFKVKWELAAVRPGRHAEWLGRGPMHSYARTVYDLQDDGDGGTDFYYSNEFKAPGGPLGAAASRVLVGGLPEREANASLHKLKQLLES
ncbi:MAG TPA: SRPBCC family protein [Solirubrobacteraceae bacterium]|nr:SRPBCC family protein [Solirubrobacteraceae bacterium]